MQHIDEGIDILNSIGTNSNTVNAYMIHPIFQNPNGLKDAIENKIYNKVDNYVLMLVMEYRNKANAFCVDQKLIITK